MATSGRELSEADRAAVKKLREEGLSVRKVADARNLSPTTVQKILKDSLAK